MPSAQHTHQDHQGPPLDGGLDPDVLRVIQALARANARRDYARAQQDALRPRNID